jgi:hypothetical protein
MTWLLPVALIPFFGLTLLACGHPASGAECDELFAKTAEIALRAQNISDRKAVADRIAAARAAEGEAFTQQCLGKRITDHALACVRRALTAEQFDRCL